MPRERTLVRLVHSEESDVDERPKLSVCSREIVPGDPALGLDPYSQYIRDSQNRMVRLLASNYCSELIDYEGMNFLIMDEPMRANLSAFFEQLAKNNIKHVFRVSKPTYYAEDLATQGVALYDLPFKDGGYPDQEVIDAWLHALQKIFYRSPKTIVAVHCVAGLGRAPLLVALALIERGMTCEDAVLYVRLRRQGAINSRQLDFLSNYMPTRAFKFKRDKKSCGIL